MKPRRGQLGFKFRTHGGFRKGAGRKAKIRRAGHDVRPTHDERVPVHVTMRVVSEIGNLRHREFYAAIHKATRVTAKRTDFRIVHMSVQRDHIHMIVEADDTSALSCGVRGFAISAARGINKVFDQRGMWREGRVFYDRYHARTLTTPRQVRNTVCYVLSNWRHHGEDRGRTWLIDLFSSGAVYPGWKELEGRPMWSLPANYEPLHVFGPRTWLLREWPRFYPLISAYEVPRGHD